MKTNKKLLSFLLSLLLIVTLMLSIGSTTALAAIDDVDVYGNSIDGFIDRFIAVWWEHFQQNRQCSAQAQSFVFVDSQLLEFDFLNRLILFFEEECEETMYDFADVYRRTGIRFFIHQYDDTYLNITDYHAALKDDSNAVLENYIWDFSDINDFYTIYTHVGQASMCGMGIWEFDSSIYQLMKDLRSIWNGNFKVYVIEREPIVAGDDPLFVTIYNSNTDSFGSESGATPGMGA